MNVKDYLFRNIIVDIDDGWDEGALEKLAAIEDNFSLTVSDRIAIWVLRNFTTSEEFTRDSVDDMGTFAGVFMTEEESERYFAQFCREFNTKE